jgi:hypothetical protein
MGCNMNENTHTPELEPVYEKVQVDFLAFVWTGHRFVQAWLPGYKYVEVEQQVMVVSDNS